MSGAASSSLPPLFESKEVLLSLLFEFFVHRYSISFYIFPPFLILLLLLYTKFRKRLYKCSRFVFTSSRFVIERKLETKKKRDNGLIISKYRSRRTRQARYDLWTTITGKFFPRLKPERGERVRETGFSDNILPWARTRRSLDGFSSPFHPSCPPRESKARHENNVYAVWTLLFNLPRPSPFSIDLPPANRLRWQKFEIRTGQEGDSTRRFLKYYFGKEEILVVTMRGNLFFWGGRKDLNGRVV